jgi:hypothetical protein
MKWAIEAAELYDKEEALRVLRKAEVFLLAFIYQGEEEASPSPPERVVRVVQD